MPLEATGSSKSYFVGQSQDQKVIIVSNAFKLQDPSQCGVLKIQDLLYFCYGHKHNKMDTCVCEIRMPPVATKSTIGYFRYKGHGQGYRSGH